MKSKSPNSILLPPSPGFSFAFFLFFFFADGSPCLRDFYLKWDICQARQPKPLIFLKRSLIHSCILQLPPKKSKNSEMQGWGGKWGIFCVEGALKSELSFSCTALPRSRQQDYEPEQEFSFVIFLLAVCLVLL